MPEFVRYTVTVRLTVEVHGAFEHDEAVVRAVKAVRKMGVAAHEEPEGVSEPRICAMSVERQR